MFHRLKALIRKEFVQMRRDRITLAMMLLLPLAQLAIFGFAINTDIKKVPTAVLDRSESAESRRLLQAFTNSDYYRILHRVERESELVALIDRGAVKVGIVIPPTYHRDVLAKRSSPVQVLVDATDPTTAASALSNSGGVANFINQEMGGRGQKPLQLYESNQLVNIRTRLWYNPDLQTSYYIVPGLIGVILCMTMMMITSMAIVKEKETGTLEQLATTPLRPIEMMIGKVVPYMVVGYVQTTIALVVAIMVFGVPIRGSLLGLYSVTFLYIVSYLGLGLLISTVSKSQQQAMQISFFIFLPTLLLSGFMFPRAGMPTFAQNLSLMLPLTYFLELLRGVILKGVGIGILWRWITPLTLLMLAFFSLAVVKFQKSFD